MSTAHIPEKTLLRSILWTKEDPLTSLQGSFSYMKKFFAIFGVSLVFVLAFGSTLLAGTLVDVFQNMESGHDGDLLTPDIMNASSHGASTWSITGQMWVSTRHTCNLPGPVTVNAVTYAGTGSTRSWMFNDANQWNFVRCSLPGRYSKATVACYYTTGLTIPWVMFDSINFLSATERTYGVFQVETSDKGGTFFRTHSASAGAKTTISPTVVKVTVGKPYWVNLHFDGDAGTVSGAVFDPEKGFAQVGTTMVAQSTVGAKVFGSVMFGRADSHGTHTNATTQSYFDNIIIDYTTAAFPLLPSTARQ
jgi:hypothetical protein